jgi:hypothetical protein
MVAPTCFGITLPSPGSVPSAFWEMLNWGAIDRIVWMGVLTLVTWCKPSGFKPPTPASERLQTNVLDRLNTGIGSFKNVSVHFITFCVILIAYAPSLRLHREVLENVPWMNRTFRLVFATRTIIFSVVLCGCETWSLTLREDRRPRVFEYRVLRRVFGPKWVEVTGEWRKLHSEELNDLYSLPNIVRVVKSRRMG